MYKLLEQIKGGKGTKVALKARYDAKSNERAGFLSRGKDYSRISLPYILPDSNTMSGDRGGNANATGYSSFAAQSVNHLSNRMVYNLFPAHQPFFSLDWTEAEKEQLKAAGYEPTELTEALTASVRKVHDYEGLTDGRVVMVNVIKHLIVTGNICLFIPPDGGNIRAIPLSNYAVVRDCSDQLVEVFTTQRKALCTFDEDLQELIKKNRKGNELKDDDEVELITWACRVGKDSYKVIQTAEDIMLQDCQEVSIDDLPWLPLRWNTCYGEDYGRGLVEDHYSDFQVLEFLSEARMKGMVLMSDVKYLVKAGAVTDIDQLATTPTGEFLVGNLDDIGVLQLEKYADFSPISATIQDYERRLGQVFLMQSSVQRDAERVTAYELRLQAQELNESLGGIYSHLSSTLQKPYAYILLQRTGFPLGKEKVKPRILTGMEALAKAGELDKIRMFTETIGMMHSWPQDLQRRTDVYDFGRQIAASLSMDLTFIRNDEEQGKLDAQAQEAQAEQMAGMEASKAIPDVIGQVTQQALGGQQ